MRRLLMYLLLISISDFSVADTAANEHPAPVPASVSPADFSSSFWPNFINNVAGQQLERLGNQQSYAAVVPSHMGAVPHSEGYLLNSQLLASPSQQYQRKYKQQQEAMTQAILVPAYPTPNLYQNSPTQQQQLGNYVSYTQLVPTFQTLNSAGIQFGSAYQPRYTNSLYNYTQGQGNHNVTVAESTPVTSSYPSVQNAYFPSSLNTPSSWPSLTISALQPSSSNGIRGYSATPLYDPTSNNGFLNSVPHLALQSNVYGQQQQQQQYPYPGFPLSLYGQTYTQPTLSIPKQNVLLENKQNPNIPASVVENKPPVHAPPMKQNHQYSSKYSEPQSEYEDEESHTRNQAQGLDESYDSDDNSPNSYKNTKSSYTSNYEEDDSDDNGADYKNSFDSAENTKRPKFIPPSVDEDFDDSSRSSKKSCNFFKSSPSKSASSHSDSFSDDHPEFSSTNFEDHFKSFPTNENFKDPDFSGESSNQKKVTDYYKKPTINEKRLKMVYNRQTKVTDSYMTPTQQRDTEIPKTLHYYNYKPPKYSYEKFVDYFPNSPVKTNAEYAKTYTTPHTPSQGYRDAVGRHSISTAVTKMKMYK